MAIGIRNGTKVQNIRLGIGHSAKDAGMKVLQYKGIVHLACRSERQRKCKKRQGGGAAEHSHLVPLAQRDVRVLAIEASVAITLDELVVAVVLEPQRHAQPLLRHARVVDGRARREFGTHARCRSPGRGDAQADAKHGRTRNGRA